jgi:hypothetical protein
VVLALVLEHLDPTVALAAVLAFAVILRSLAGALTGTTVEAETTSRNAFDGERRRDQRWVMAILAPDLLFSFMFLVSLCVSFWSIRGGEPPRQL